ncbi:hypothetical protein C0995_010339 [Termitomyces sp. Mi166|nr:hypothetical protein C0995_010339 [Termitomyces sp. Mi166\
MDAEPRGAIANDTTPQIDDPEIDDDKGCVEDQRHRTGMRTTPPPIPPSLKKRQRWSLTLPLIRRRSSQPNDNAVVPGETKETRSASVDITPRENSKAIIRHS